MFVSAKSQGIVGKGMVEITGDKMLCITVRQVRAISKR